MTTTKTHTSNISLYTIVKSMANGMDLISETVVGHHKKVAYIASQLGKQLDLSKKEIRKLIITSLIHDLGVFHLNQTFSNLSFDSKNNQHAKVGYLLSRNLFPDKKVPEIIKYHHHEWGNNKENIPHYSHLLFLADRIAVLIKDKIDILSQSAKIKNNIKNHSGKRFWPEAVNKFINLAKIESFWLDVISEKRIENHLNTFFSDNSSFLNFEDLNNISLLISHIIDFRSPFTATHTRGVAASASKLAQYLDFSKKDIKMMNIAGNLHDLGKLIVPVEILNKPGKLKSKEWNIMKTHTYFTYHTFDNSEKLEDIKKWAAYHHEKLNGNGYPFHLTDKDLSLGARIMAVADIFTAISENRPYREGMKAEEIKNILTEMVENNEIDGKVVSVIIDNFDEFKKEVTVSQNNAQDYYQRFKEKVKEITD